MHLFILARKQSPRFGRNARKGGNRKNFDPKKRVGNKYLSSPMAAAPTSNAPHATAAPPNKKQSAAAANKKAAYAMRDSKKIKAKNESLKQELLDIKIEHEHALKKERSKLAAKSQQCNALAFLAQEHKRASNIATHEAAATVATMEEQNRCIKNKADAKMISAEQFSSETIRAERAFQLHKMKTRKRQHSTELERTVAWHNKDKVECQKVHQRQIRKNTATMESKEKTHQHSIMALKADHTSSINRKDKRHEDKIKTLCAVHKKEVSSLEKEHTKEAAKVPKDHKELINKMNETIKRVTRERNKHKEGEQKVLRELLEKLAAHKEEVDRLTLVHQEDLKKLKSQHTTDIVMRKGKIDKLQWESKDLISRYNSIVEQCRQAKNDIKKAGNKINRISGESQIRLLKMRDYQIKYQRANDSVVKEHRSMM